MIKNGVNITGLIDPDELSQIACEHIITFSSSDYIFVNRRKHPLNQLISINIAVDISNNEKINLRDTSILLIQGIKQFTIEYRDDKRRRSVITRSLPFTKTAFLNSIEFDYKKVNLFILDSTLQILNHEVIFVDTSYLLTVEGNGPLETLDRANYTANAAVPNTVIFNNVDKPYVDSNIPSPEKIASAISIPEENVIIDSSKYDIEEEFL